MKNNNSFLKHIAPTLASALRGPFAKVADKFIADNLVGQELSSEQDYNEKVEVFLNDSKNLQKIKDADKQFKTEMEELKVDVFSLEGNEKKKLFARPKIEKKPQIIISALFLSAYFLILSAIFIVETSDTINMRQGENSLLGEIQILLGVLTAGVAQILSFWFGVDSKNNSDQA